MGHTDSLQVGIGVDEWRVIQDMPGAFMVKYKQGFISNQVGRDKPGLVPGTEPLAEIHRKRIRMNSVEEHTPETIFCENALRK